MIAFLSLGSNIGNRLDNLEQAFNIIIEDHPAPYSRTFIQTLLLRWVLYEQYLSPLSPQSVSFSHVKSHLPLLSLQTQSPRL